MAGTDWLVGDRRTTAAERIYSAASDVIARDGFDALDVDVLAAKVHCSRATVYRYVGGKRQIGDVLLARAADRVVGRIRVEIEGLSGRDRVVTAVVLGLEGIRRDPLGKFMAESLRGVGQMGWITATPRFVDLGLELIEVADGDRAAGEWILRVVLALVYWPAEDHDMEREIVSRFVGPAFE